MGDVRSQIRAEPPASTRAWVAQCVGSRARVDAWMTLEGGSACAIHAVDVIDAVGLRHPLVLKRFFRADWLAREPEVAAREARHLKLLEAVDLEIPRLVGVDPDASVCDHPAVLMTRLPGRSELLPENLDTWLNGLAEPLIVLHALGEDICGQLAPYRSYNDLATLQVPGWSQRPKVWQRVLERVRGDRPAFGPRFVHRDYHPTNLLWTRGRVTGVLDFTDSSRGPASVDVGHCRLNLAQLHGPKTAERFLEIHEALAPGSIEVDPYWDLLALIDILPGPEGVYWGWTKLGVGGLTTPLVRERLDDYAAQLVAKRG
jgi:aminoglycoside phosphotransferase (APT) family kinase protein